MDFLKARIETYVHDCRTNGHFLCAPYLKLRINCQLLTVVHFNKSMNVDGKVSVFLLN